VGYEVGHAKYSSSDKKLSDLKGWDFAQQTLSLQRQRTRRQALAEPWEGNPQGVEDSSQRQARQRVHILLTATHRTRPKLWCLYMYPLLRCYNQFDVTLDAQPRVQRFRASSIDGHGNHSASATAVARMAFCLSQLARMLTS
jgi:hypothetical protein